MSCVDWRSPSIASFLAALGRERWHNHLKPDISKAEWTEEEDRTILELHQSVGNKWSELAKKLPGRYVLLT